VKSARTVSAEVTIPTGTSTGQYSCSLTRPRMVRSSSRIRTRIPYQIDPDPELPVLDAIGFRVDQRAILLDSGSTVRPKARSTHRDAPFSGTLKVVSRNTQQPDSVRAQARWDQGITATVLGCAPEGIRFNSRLDELLADKPWVLIRRNRPEADAEALRTALAASRQSQRTSSSQ